MSQFNFKKITMMILSITSVSFDLVFAEVRITPEVCRGGLISIDGELSESDKREIEVKCGEAFSASATLQVKAVGRDSYDCHRNVESRARHEEREVIRQCERNAQDVFSCEITRSRMIDYGSSISETHGSGNYEERKSDEITCRNSSVSRAEQDAIRQCELQYDVPCELTERGIVDEYKVKRRRRFIIMGPKEDYHICRAHAYAAPVAPYNTECSIELEARVKRF